MRTSDICSDPPVARTQDMGRRRVNIDWDESGNVIGVELL